LHYISKELDYLPADTVLDGELVALGTDGKPNFNLLQNFKSTGARHPHPRSYDPAFAGRKTEKPRRTLPSRISLCWSAF
jgi:hypothetical protein